MLPQTFAGRLEQLLDLYAPKVLDEDGVWRGERDESAGLISREDLLMLLELA